MLLTRSLLLMLVLLMLVLLVLLVLRLLVVLNCRNSLHDTLLIRFRNSFQFSCLFLSFCQIPIQISNRLANPHKLSMKRFHFETAFGSPFGSIAPQNHDIVEGMFGGLACGIGALIWQQQQQGRLIVDSIVIILRSSSSSWHGFLVPLIF